MVKSCSMHGSDEKCIGLQHFGQKSEGKRPLGISSIDRE